MYTIGMIVTAITTRRFLPEDNLLSFIKEYIPVVKEKTVLIITSKLISLAQNLITEDVPAEKMTVLEQESEWFVEDEWGYIAYRDGMLVGSAGIDKSNAFGKMLLLPKDCYELAEEISKELREYYKIKNFGVIISDSRSIPLRYGALGMSLGHYGFNGVKNHVGEEDLDGRKIVFEKSNKVDALTCAAVAQMGEVSEMRPLCVIENPYVEFINEKVDTSKIIVPFKEDRFFRSIKSILRKID